MSDTQETPERLGGTVKWFNSSKGFGFITADGTEDEIFVHQTNIETTGFRSLREGEPVEFVLTLGEDGKKKAFHVTGPGGASPLGSTDQQQRASPGFNARANGTNPMQPFDPSVFPPPGEFGPVFPPSSTGHSQSPQQQQINQQQQLTQLDNRGQGNQPHAFYPPMPHEYMGYYPMTPPGGFTAYAMIPQQQQQGGRGRGQYFPGGKNWVGARPPPPGQPGFSSGLQVVVHNLPWDCTWQQLREAFADCGEIERADVVFDSRGRSRGFGVVRFPTKDCAEKAVDQMNNQTIGGRVVSVRLDRFA